MDRHLKAGLDLKCKCINVNEIVVDNAISKIALVKQQKQSTIWEKDKHKKKMIKQNLLPTIS